MTEYQYDSSGVYFNYFIMTILGLFLFPVTWMYISHMLKPAELPESGCQSEQSRFKHDLIRRREARSLKSPRISKLFVAWLVGWVAFGVVFYSVMTTEYEEDLKIFDPYSVLGISTGATEREIKKAYRKLSLLWHPDKVDDKEKAEMMFVDISKAYRSLTDDETRENWEKYGDPDGKPSVAYGIALPSWIVDPSYKNIILAIYGSLFGIILPLMLSRWWNFSKKFTREGVLNLTMGVYFQDLKENFNSKKILELLCASVEFQEGVEWRGERDMDAVMALFRKVRDKVHEKTGEKLELPKKYNQPYCYKAFVISYAQIFRVPIEDELLREDSYFIIPKMAFLATKGVMNLTSAHYWLNQSIACLELSRMMIQAVPLAWNHMENSELHQLPHFSSEQIKLARNKKKSIKTISQFVELPVDERKAYLEEIGLNTAQVKNVLAVLPVIPSLKIENALFECKGEARITPGSLVTFKLKLKAVDGNSLLKGPPSPTVVEDVDSDDEESSGKRSTRLTKLLSGTLFHNPNEPVYCPYFPAVKRPVYYMYLCNPKNNRVVGTPTAIPDLEPGVPKTVKFTFQAPNQTGTFGFTCIVQCDSYLGSVSQEVKLTVEKARDEEEEVRNAEDKNAWKDLEEEEEMEKDGLLGAQSAMMSQQGKLSKEAEEDANTDWESSDFEED